MTDGTTKRWDFFIAHAGPDGHFAQMLFEHLAAASRPFLDSKCLTLGDDWDRELQEAQRMAQVTVVLVSAHTPTAYYQREEVAAAIAMARDPEKKHRVVPLYLPGTSPSAEEIPYGLRLKHGISVQSDSDFKAVAEKLLFLVKSNRDVDPGAPTSGVSDDEADLIRSLFRGEGRCKISSAREEYECLWVPDPGVGVNIAWGWERTAQYAREAGKTIGDREERLRWIFVVRDLVARGLLFEHTKANPGRGATFYELTELGWRTGLALAPQGKKPRH